MGFISLALSILIGQAAPVEPPPLLPANSPLTLERIQRAILRINYHSDVRVVKLGVDQIRKLRIGGATWEPVDFSQHTELKTALVNVLEANRETSGLTEGIRIEAAKLLGETQLLALATDNLVRLSSSEVEFAVVQAAVKSFTQTTKTLPNRALVTFFIQKDAVEYLRELAEIVPDDEVVAFLVQRYGELRHAERLYRIDHILAADASVADFLTQFVIPSGPSALELHGNFEKKSITLVWVDTSLNETMFVIEQSLDGTNWVKIQELGNNQISFVNVKLQPNTQYFYRVFAKNGAGLSEPSPVADHTLVFVEPPPPTEPPTEPPPPYEPPTSPPPREAFESLASRLRGWVRDEPYLPGIRALLKVVEEGTGRVSVSSSEALGNILNRKAFDWSPEMTSVSLRALNSIENRGSRDSIDYSITPAERKDYPPRHKAVAGKLERVFYDQFK